MKRLQTNFRHRLGGRWRVGSTISELLVASSLLVTTVAMIGAATVNAHRLLHSGREYRVAVDELSNQMEYLLSIDSQRLASAIESLQPTAHAQSLLDAPSITGEIIESDDGRRLELQLQWTRPGEAAPLLLVGWLSEGATDLDQSGAAL